MQTFQIFSGEDEHMKKKLIIANWKMNPSSATEAKKLFSSICRSARRRRKINVVICPPSVFLGDVRNSATPQCTLGAQDVSVKSSPSGVGAYTGEVSSAMLASAGVRYVLVGHSERRTLGETDAMVSQKIHAVIRDGLTPVLCVGEAVRDKEGEYLHFLRKEINDSLGSVKKRDISKIIMAYEPIWAVGKNAERADTPDELFEMTILIRKIIGESYGRSIAMALPILYGGSVDENNAEAFLLRGGIQGFLVGRASINSDIFGHILKKAESVKSSEH